MEESKSKASASRGRRRIVVTGVGGIAGIMILGGAFAVASMIKNKSIKRVPDTGEGGQDVPASPTQKLNSSCSGAGSSSNTTAAASREEGSEGLRSLLETSSPECVEEHDASRITLKKIEDCCLEPIEEDESTVDITITAKENWSTTQDVSSKTSIEDESSIITASSTHIDRNDRVSDTVETPIKVAGIPLPNDVPIQEHISATEVIIQDKISNCEDLYGCKSTTEDKSATEVIEEVSCEAKQDAPSTTPTKIDDCCTELDTVETPIKEAISSTEVIVEENLPICEQHFSCNSRSEHEASRATLTQIDDNHSEPETIETPIMERSAMDVEVEENDSSCEELLSCKSNNEHDASTVTSTDDYYHEVETVEILPVMEEKLAIEVTVEKEIHKEVTIEAENLETVRVWAPGAVDMIKDETSVTVSEVSVDSDESSVTLDGALKEEMENEDEEMEGETEDSEGTRDSSIESNSEAVWPVESTEEELLLLKDRAQGKISEEKLYKETSGTVEEGEFVIMSQAVTEKVTGFKLRNHPSKILPRGGFLVWLLLVVGLLILLFASDLPMSYHLSDHQLSSS